MRVSLSMIRPELRRFGTLIRLVFPGFTEGTLHVAGRLSKRMAGKCRSAIGYEQIYLARPDGSSLRLCVYSPLDPKRDVPGILWMHGGGYALGVPEQDEVFIRRFVEASSCVVVSPDYRLSVDAPYPAALFDCYQALLWLKEHGGKYGMRSDQIMVGGNSAGGGLAVAVCLYARDKGEVAIAFQMPLYPMLDDRMDTPSALLNNAPLWNTKSSHAGWKLYLGEMFGKKVVPAYSAPARAEDYRGLPPACSYVGSIEPFRDEMLAYMKNLSSTGISVQYRVFEGCFHGFDIVRPKSAAAREAAGFLMDRFGYAVSHYFANQPEVE